VPVGRESLRNNRRCAAARGDGAVDQGSTPVRRPRPLMCFQTHSPLSARGTGLALEALEVGTELAPEAMTFE